MQTIKSEIEDFKISVLTVIDQLIREAVQRGKPTEPIFIKLGAESLELAARIHMQFGGTDVAFIAMAQNLLDAMRAGAQDQ